MTTPLWCHDPYDVIWQVFWHENLIDRSHDLLHADWSICTTWPKCGFLIGLYRSGPPYYSPKTYFFVLYQWFYLLFCKFTANNWTNLPWNSWNNFSNYQHWHHLGSCFALFGTHQHGKAVGSINGRTHVLKTLYLSYFGVGTCASLLIIGVELHDGIKYGINMFSHSFIRWSFGIFLWEIVTFGT